MKFKIGYIFLYIAYSRKYYFKKYTKKSIVVKGKKLIINRIISLIVKPDNSPNNIIMVKKINRALIILFPPFIRVLCFLIISLNLILSNNFINKINKK